ncbi:MAG TPA: ATP-binding cassette domain-containing protein [Candidatus Tetragenococcus pullicola]|nr:ATP-binding cassette domain-containing protein [Candidatus Tetragenococcus pullicola]
MIKVKNVSKYYDQTTRGLENISFEVASGEFVYLIGPNGSGKTTLLKVLTKEIENSQGFVQIDRFLIDKMSKEKLYLLRRNIGIIGQEDLFLPQQTVYQNVAFALQAVETKTKEIHQKAMKSIEKVGMSALRDTYIENCSIGQKKKVAIARAIANDPLLILADEPMANLDGNSSVEMMKLFLRLNLEGVTILMATHDSTMVNSVRKRVLELEDGHLIRDEKLGGYSFKNDPKDIYVW